MALLMVQVFRGVLILVGLAALAATAVPAISTNTWWIRTFDFARLQTLVLLIIIAVLLLLSWRRPAVLPFILLLAAGAAYNASILYFYTPVHGVEQLGAASCPANRRLRLLEVNVQMTNQHDERLLDIVRRVKPDVAWFQETDEWWAGELAALSDEMPHHVSEAQPNYFGVALYSRLELVDPQIVHLTRSADPAVFTGVKLASRDVVRLYAVHPRPPQEGQGTAERDGQLLAAALAARDDQAPHLLVGDLNSVPWEDVVHRAKRVGRFLNPRIGRGLDITWNAHSWILKWPLDQILPAPDFTLLSLHVLPAFGSDHRPYLAELCLDPAVAARQPAPALEPGDIELTQRAVRAGQGEADKTGIR